jgi:hypothetical protein
MFLFLYLCFFFYKIREQEGGTGSSQRAGAIGTSGRVEMAGKGVRG